MGELALWNLPIPFLEEFLELIMQLRQRGEEVGGRLVLLLAKVVQWMAIKETKIEYLITCSTRLTNDSEIPMQSQPREEARCHSHLRRVGFVDALHVQFHVMKEPPCGCVLRTCWGNGHPVCVDDCVVQEVRDPQLEPHTTYVGEGDLNI